MATYNDEMMLPPVRWVVRNVYPGFRRVLQQEWLIEEYGNPEKLGQPKRTRREWRDVPVVVEE